MTEQQVPYEGEPGVIAKIALTGSKLEPLIEQARKLFNDLFAGQTWHFVGAEAKPLEVYERMDGKVDVPSWEVLFYAATALESRDEGA